MTMTEWAEREIAAACKIENPNWDGNSFDYGCSCYQSAQLALRHNSGTNTLTGGLDSWQTLPPYIHRPA